MNLKKFISGVSAITIAASTFAALAVTASAAVADHQVYYIGSAEGAEDFDDYSTTGWTTDSLGSGDSFGIADITATRQVEVGQSVVDSPTIYATYADFAAFKVAYPSYNKIFKTSKSINDFKDTANSLMGNTDADSCTTVDDVVTVLNTWAQTNQANYSFRKGTSGSYTTLEATITVTNDAEAAEAICLDSSNQTYDHVSGAVKYNYALDTSEGNYVVKETQTIYPTYVSGKSLRLRCRSGEKTAKLTMPSVRTSGKLYFDSDMAMETSGSMRGQSVYLYDSEGSAVITITAGAGAGDSYITVPGNNGAQNTIRYTSRAVQLQGYHLSIVADLDTGSVTATVDGTNNTKTRATVSKTTTFATANGIAALGIKSAQASKENNDIILDNTLFYAVDKAESLTVSYICGDTEIGNNPITITDKVVGDTQSYAVPAYLEYNNRLYKATGLGTSSAGNARCTNYTKTVTLDDVDDTDTVEYAVQYEAGTVYEFEEFDGVGSFDHNRPWLYSNNKASTVSTAGQTVITAPEDGTYDVYASISNKTSGAYGNSVTLSANGNNIGTAQSYNAAVALSGTVTLNKDDVITATSTNDNMLIDYILIVKQGPYAITSSEDHCTISVNDSLTEASGGTSISFTVSPDPNYTVDTVTVNGETCEPENGTYTFTMPKENVTISATAHSIVVDSVKVRYELSDHTEILTETLPITSCFGSDMSTAITAAVEGDSVYIPFKAYILKNGTLYQTTQNNTNPYYGNETVLTSDTVLTKTVTASNVSGTIVVFDDNDGTTAQNAYIRASNMKANDNAEYTSSASLTPGVYTFIFRRQSKGRGSSIKVGDQTLFEYSTIGTCSWDTTTLTNIPVTAGGYITHVAGGSRTRDDLDYMIAIKTGELAETGEVTALGTYTTDEGDFAKAFTFTVTPNAETITSVTVTDAADSTKSVTKSGLSLSGSGAITFGILVTAADAANLDKTFKVTLN